MTLTAEPHAGRLDIDAVRAQFPALLREVNGLRCVYLDGPAGSQVPSSVVHAVSQYLTHSNANIDGLFATAAETDALITHARIAAGDLIGCQPEEVVFGPNTTTINFLLAHAVARTLAPGDEIITTKLEHDSNVSPWLLVAQDHGLVVRVAPLRPEDGTLDYAALEQLINSRTRIVAVTAASNALGSITDVRRVTDLAHQASALAWVDAVHFTPHRRLNRDALGADVILTSPYKYFGPHLGVAAVRSELAQSWPADRVRPAAQTPAGHRFETGTQNHEAIAGFVAAVDYLAGLGQGQTRVQRLDSAFAHIQQHETELSRLTLERLAENPRCRLFGIADPARAGERTPTFCFRVEGWEPRAIQQRLADQGIFVWEGNFYALGVTTAFDIEDRGGAVRAGFLHYTTSQEAERLCGAIEELS